MSSSSSSSKACFNSDCNNLKPDHPCRGWRLRSGDFAELCDRCSSAYEEGRFCDTFHLNVTGWRSCDSCGKRVHCGCIVSSHAFVLLDAGGIDCLSCARKNIMVTPHPAGLPSLFSQQPFSEKLKDPAVKHRIQLAGSGPVPWRQAPSLFNSVLHSEHPRAPYDVDISASLDRYNSASERFSALSMENKAVEELSRRQMNGSLKLGTPETVENGKSGIYQPLTFEELYGRLMNGTLKLGTPETVENGKSGIKGEEKLDSCLNISQLTSIKEDPSTAQFALAMPFVSRSETSCQNGISGSNSRLTTPSSLSKQFHGNTQNGFDSSGETQMRNARPRGDTRGKNQLLPRYWPRITDQELKQISGDSNSKITPLFEKMLSASDAGRIGRLVLPKKCAEAYFPPISQPEGLPLKVQDLKGKEWVFQFRFWPNNNSRMYVLEGVTPCIQSMQLQAGDIVTFSRLEPEGKLIMGFRKASTPPFDQGNETINIANGVPYHVDAELADPSSRSKVDKTGYIAKDAFEVKSSISRKRKNSTLGSKSKRLRIENEDMMELKLTWEEAQGLLRAPDNHIPNVVLIEGFEFEEYEEAPILGKPTIFATDSMGENIQWAQCEDCLKWRKLPAAALLSSKWICSDNSWDPERTLCSAPQELTMEQIEDLLPACNSAASNKKMKAAEPVRDNIDALEGLDALANLAVMGEGEALAASGQATTRHPRHRPGCTCIVCIQPPSGKGPKHKQACTCNVCLTVKRRFRTLMMRRERKHSKKEPEIAEKQQQQLHFPEKLVKDETVQYSNTVDISLSQKLVNYTSDEDNDKTKVSTSPFKGQIDLNIQPEREEELSPGSDSNSMPRSFNDAADRYNLQQISSGYGNESSPLQIGSGTGEKLDNCVIPRSSHQDADKEHKPET